MNRNTSPGVGQWVTVSLMVAVSLFLLIKLYQYAGLRGYYPTGLTIAGIDVGGMTPEEASEILTNRYLEAPITLYHRDEQFVISPAEAEFTLDLTRMLSDADFQRVQQDFWAGFWGYLWGTPVEVAPVPLSATHNREALGDVLTRIANLTDEPAQPPQPVPGSLSFQYGVAGTITDIEASFSDVEAALYRPINREARLVVEPRAPIRPDNNLLTRLLVNRVQVFEQESGGIASVFIMDLQTGEEIALRSDVVMSGMDLLKIPIAVEAYRVLRDVPTLTQRQLISDTLIVGPNNPSTNALLSVIAGSDEPYTGARLVTNSMQRLGLKNTFMLTPYDEPMLPGLVKPQTPANSAESVLTHPNDQMQTTAEDIGTLLSMVYYCAQGQGGALMAVFDDEITQEECRQLLQYMRLNKIGSLLEEGVPAGVALSHRHGWVSDTLADAGVVFTPGGDYVIVAFLYKSDWLEWELSSPLVADVARATYNYFNFDQPFLGG
ncbi:MAG: serine hydrolase [Chloroflexota bacterium]